MQRCTQPATDLQNAARDVTKQEGERADSTGSHRIRTISRQSTAEGLTADTHAALANVFMHSSILGLDIALEVLPEERGTLS
jgi:hypothetical protein